MTETRRLELEEKLNLAEASGDPKQIAAVKKTMEQEYRLCTSHTADRLKRVEATVNQIKEGLIPADMFSQLQKGLTDATKTITEVKEEIAAWKNRAHGAKIIWTILRYLAAAGGGGLLLSLLNAGEKVVQTPIGS